MPQEIIEELSSSLDVAQAGKQSPDGDKEAARLNRTRLHVQPSWAGDPYCVSQLKFLARAFVHC
jgi:hypothetical protein